MPTVSEAFVKNSQALAEGFGGMQTKLAAAEAEIISLKAASEKSAATVVAPKDLSALADATADTLVSQGLVPANEKAAAVANLLDHEQAIQALNKTAQMVRYESMGSAETEKKASTNSNMAASDRQMLEKLGFNV